jgi:methyl-accepting chemotaxis protein
MLSRLKIGQRLYLLGATQLAAMLFMGSVALVQMGKVGDELVDIAERNIPLTGFVTKITEHQLEQSILVERAFFSGSLLSQNVPGIRQQFTAHTTDIAALTKQVKAEIASTEVFVAEAMEVIHSEQGKARFTKVLFALKQAEQYYGEFIIQVDKALNTARSGDLLDLVEQAGEVAILEDAMHYELGNLLADVQNFTLEASLKAESDEKAGVLWIALSLAIALLIGAILPLVIGRSITNPINYLSSRLAEIADGDGDLTVALRDTDKDEVGDVARAFNKFLSVIRVFISNTSD